MGSVKQVESKELATRAAEMIDNIISRTKDNVALLLLSELKTVVKRMARQNALRKEEIVRLNSIIEFERATREQIVSMEVQERMIHEIIVDGQD